MKNLKQSGKSFNVSSVIYVSNDVWRLNSEFQTALDAFERVINDLETPLQSGYIEPFINDFRDVSMSPMHIYNYYLNDGDLSCTYVNQIDVVIFNNIANA